MWLWWVRGSYLNELNIVEVNIHLYSNFYHILCLYAAKCHFLKILNSCSQGRRDYSTSRKAETTQKRITWCILGLTLLMSNIQAYKQNKIAVSSWLYYCCLVCFLGCVLRHLEARFVFSMWSNSFSTCQQLILLVLLICGVMMCLSCLLRIPCACFNSIRKSVVLILLNYFVIFLI